MTFTWEDPKPRADNDNEMEAGEAVRVRAGLTSSTSVKCVYASLTTSDPDVVITQPRVFFDDFSAGSTASSINPFDMQLSFKDHRTSVFSLHVTYQIGDN